MDEKLKKDILKHLGVYKVMTEIAIKDHSVDFIRKKILQKQILDELNLIIEKLNNL